MSKDVITSTNEIAERRSIEYIPLDERVGKPRSLFGIWFGFNMVPLACVVGAVGTTLGLPLLWTILAVLLGNLLGGLTMGLHATQGPRLGVPQMLQARGQFGRRGASILAAAVVIVGIGFFSFNIIVATQAIQLVFHDVPTVVAVTISSFVSLAISIVGYRLIRVTSAMVALGTGLIVALVIVLLLTGQGPTGVYSVDPELTVGAFFAAVTVAGSWQVGFAPFVSDYSRYMPQRGERAAFWGTYLGATCGGSLMMILGAYLASRSAIGEPLAALAEGFGGFGNFVLVAFFVSVALANTINSYTAGLCVLTLLETFRPGISIPVSWRNATLVLVHAAGFTLALAAAGSFTENFLNFVTLLLYLLIPWSAINLADYFLVRHGEYDINSFFAQDGGEYGLWNSRAVIAYAGGILAQLPFLQTAFYTGPLVDPLGGVDLAWIVGFIVPGVLFIALNRPSTADH